MTSSLTMYHLLFVTRHIEKKLAHNLKHDEYVPQSFERLLHTI